MLIYIYIYIYIYKEREREYNLMETQTRLSRHNKFISAENITLLSVLSDDYIFTESIVICPDIGLAVRVFANGPGDQGSIPGRVTKDSKNGT